MQKKLIDFLFCSPYFSGWRQYDSPRKKWAKVWYPLHSKSISNGVQYVTPDSKIYCKKVKMCWFSSGHWFSAPNSCILPWLVDGATQLCTSKTECNRLDLTAAQYFFWLVDHNDRSRWFAISSPHVYADPFTVVLVGLPKQIQLNLDILFYYPEWHTEHRWRCSKLMWSAHYRNMWSILFEGSSEASPY